jgi:hypothetical protein
LVNKANRGRLLSDSCTPLARLPPACSRRRVQRQKLGIEHSGCHRVYYPRHGHYHGRGGLHVRVAGSFSIESRSTHTSTPCASGCGSHPTTANEDMTNSFRIQIDACRTGMAYKAKSGFRPAAATSVLGVCGRRRKDDVAVSKIENGKIKKGCWITLIFLGCLF